MTAALPTLELPAIAELAEYRRWVLWRYEERAGKVTKVPIQTNGRKASSTDPRTWAWFADVFAAYQRGVGDGLGFVFTDSPFAGVDLDNCIRSDGIREPWAQAIVERFDSYIEKSPSGRGLHIIVRGRLPGPGRKRGAIEIYDSGRYFTVTGDLLAADCQIIGDCSDALAALYHELAPAGGGERVAGRHDARPWDGHLPKSVALAATADATVRLTLRKPHRDLGYASASEADFALACVLLEAGFGEADVEAALRWRHAHTEPRPKSVEYFPRTVANAKTQVAGRGRQRVSS